MAAFFTNNCKYIFAFALVFTSALSARAEYTFNFNPQLELPEIPSNTSNKDVIFNAKDIIHDFTNQLTEARGNVFVSWGKGRLYSDSLLFNEKTGIVTARGNVRVFGEDGTNYRTEYFEMSDDLAHMVIPQIEVRMPKGAMFVAKSMQKNADGKQEMLGVGYQICSRCVDEEQQKPSWSITSKKATYDEEKDFLLLNDVSFNVKDRSLFTLPWLWQSDVSKRTKSGFLLASFEANEEYGYHYQIPYLWVINEHNNIKYTPHIYFPTGEEEINNSIDNDKSMHIRHELLYRQRVAGGGHNTLFTYAPKDDNKENHTKEDFWKVDSTAWLQLSDEWFFDSRINLVSDFDYLEYYDIEKEKDKAGFLLSYAQLERRASNQWLNLKYSYYQHPSKYIANRSSAHIPELNYHRQSEQEYFGGHINTYVNYYMTQREIGDDVSRLYNDTSWETNKVHHNSGLEINFGSSLASMLFIGHDFDYQDKSIQRELILRPTSKLTLSYPLLYQGQKNSAIIEPVVQAVWSDDYLINKKDFENSEISRQQNGVSLDLMGHNLFSTNRADGVDISEKGLRVNYGFRGNFHLGDNFYGSWQIGQVWSSNYDDYHKFSGLNREFSDIVAYADLSPHPWFNMTASTRYDWQENEFEKTDISAAIGPDSLKFSGYYTMFNNIEDNKYNNELAISLSSKITDNLTINAGFTKNLNAEYIDFSDISANILWATPYYNLKMYASKEWKDLPNKEPETTVGITFSLTSLGGFSYSPELEEDN